MIWKKLSLFLLYFCLSVFVFFMGVRQPNIDGFEKSRYIDMVYGKAHKPFVYRTLLPSAVRAISSATPLWAKSALKSAIGQFYSVDAAFDKMSWDKRYYFEYLVGFFLMILSLTGFMYGLRYLVTVLFDTSPVTAGLVPAFAIFGIPALISYYIYPYDYSGLFLFTLAFALLASGKWTQYLMIFTLACINKETAILLPLLFVILNYEKWKANKPILLKRLLAQLAIFIIIKSAITIIFYSNPGGFMEFHLFDYNFERFYRPYSLYSLVSFIVLCILVFYKWKSKPIFLRKAALLIIPLFSLILFWGVLDEIRVYYEVYPVIALLIIHTI